jgi:hypothetical protein
MTLRKNYWNRERIALLLMVTSLMYMLEIQITIMNLPKFETETTIVLLEEESFEETSSVLEEENLGKPSRILEVKTLQAPEKEYSDEEKLVMCLSYAEAYNQGIYGQKLVMETVRNRLEDERFPDNFDGVCCAARQFNTIKNGCAYTSWGKVDFDDDITDEMKKAFDEVMNGSLDTEELLKQVAYSKGLTDEKYWKGGALYFSNLDTIYNNSPDQYSSYQKIQVYVKVGDHTFWRYWG